MSVGYAVDGGVAWLTIERPEARNALSLAVRDGLREGVRRFNTDDTAAVFVLTGAGDKAFCAGGDLKEMANTSLQVPPPDLLPRFGRNSEVPEPTIAEEIWEPLYLSADAQEEPAAFRDRRLPVRTGR